MQANSEFAKLNTQLVDTITCILGWARTGKLAQLTHFLNQIDETR